MTVARITACAFFLIAAFFAVTAPVFGETPLPTSASPSPAIELVRQGHPVFYDLGSGPAPLNEYRDIPYIQATIQSLRGNWGDKLVKWGVLRPKYMVDISLNHTELAGLYSGAEWSKLELVEVAWEFPKEYYFVEPEAIEATVVRVDAWRPFFIKARVKLTNGTSKSFQFQKWVDIPPITQ